jgi:hypothetical protein
MMMTVLHMDPNAQVGPKDQCYDEYPELGIEEWHKKHGVYIKKATK